MLISKQMMDLLFAIALLSSPMPAFAENAEPAATAIQLAKIDAVMAEGIDARAIAGGVVGVMRDGKIVMLKAYGATDLEDGQSNTPDTIFRIGSITKQFTAAMLLMLVERGQLSLSDPIAKYLPEIPRSDGITVRHLLDHTSGIHSYTDSNFVESRATKHHSTDELVAYIAGQAEPIDFAPGTDYRYNNSGYVLAGAIIERVTGKPYAAALQDMILTPQGLTDSAFDDERLVLPRRAKGYAQRDGVLAHPLPLSWSVAGSAGAMRSTATDLLRWHHALLGGKVVTPESLALMTTPSRLKDGSPVKQLATPDPPEQAPMDYGLGLSVGTQGGRRVVGHWGAINGFNACLFSYPDQRTTIVLLVNTEGGANARVWRIADAWFAQDRSKEK
jgi:D-alanyl-D-alanine carboxypeptidase